MFVNTNDTTVIDVMTNLFGLNYSNGKLSGNLNFPDELISDTVDEELRKKYQQLLKAYTSSIQEDCELSIYTGELGIYNKVCLEARGFYVNDHDVIFMKDITHETYDRLVYFSTKPVVSVVTEIAIAIVFSNWPKILVAERFRKDSDTYQLTSTPRFDYVYGVSKFHVKVPIPFDKVAKTSRTEYVLVEFSRDLERVDYKYEVLVANFPPIYTNTEPTPDTIGRILSTERHWLTKLKKFFKITIK